MKCYQTKIILLLVSYSFLLTKSYCATPIILKSPQSSTIKKFETYTLHFDLAPSVQYTNVYDPTIVDVSGIFTSPSGATFKVFGYYYEDYLLACNGEVESLTPQPNNNEWQIAFTPNEVGNWTYQLSVKDASGTNNISGNFTCIDGTSKGFIKTANSKYLKYDNGTLFYPVGMNVKNYDQANYATGSCQYKKFIDNLAQNNANFIRVWIDIPGSAFSIGGYDFNTNSFYYNTFNQRSSYQLDWLLKYCLSKNINLQLVLFENEYFDSGTWANYNPFNASLNKGGTLNNPCNFFTDAEAIKVQKNKIRYILARWGSYTNIMSFELFNEINQFQTTISQTYQNQLPPNFNSSITDWTAQMKNYYSSINTFGHLITVSTAGDQHSWVDGIFSNMDFISAHNYRSPEINTSEEFGYIDSYLQGIDMSTIPKPYMIGEYGWSAGEIASSNDPNGFLLHSDYWTCLMSGNMGLLNVFWNDTYINPDNLYSHFKPISKFVNSIPTLSNNITLSNNTDIVHSITYRNYYFSDNTNNVFYGWVQDVNFSYNRLNASHKNYLYNKFADDKPAVSSTAISFNIPITRNGEYLIEWYNCETGDVFTTQYMLSQNGKISLTMPQALRATTYGDAAYKIKYLCTATPSFTINGSSSTDFIVLDYSSPVILDGSASTGETGYFISIQTVDQNLVPYGTEYSQWYSSPVSTFDIQNFYKSKTGAAQIPLGNFKIKLGVQNSSNGGCTSYAESAKYIKKTSCAAIPSFTINESSSLTPIPVNYSSPVILNGTASTGETGYFISIQAVNQSLVPYGTEYSQWYTGTISTFDVQNFYSIKTGSQIPAGLYKIKLALQNTPNGGCTNFAESSKYIKMNCEATPSFTLNGSSSLDFIPLGFGAPIILDGSASTSETKYFISLQTVNPNLSTYGTEYSQWYSGSIGTFDMQLFFKNKTGANYIAAGNYKIKVAVQNTSNGGCTNYTESAKYVTIGCTAIPSFTLNGSSSLDFIPVDYLSTLIIDGSASVGETGYAIVMQAVNQNLTTYGPEYLQWYSGPITTFDAQNFWGSKTGVYRIPMGSYKIKVAVQNSPTGGCTNYAESAKYITVNCPNAVSSSFDINGFSSNNSIVSLKPNTSVIMNVHSTGETQYSLTIQELNANGLPLDDSGLPTTVLGDGIWYSGKTPGRIDIRQHLQLALNVPWPQLVNHKQYKITLLVKNSIANNCIYSSQATVNFFNNSSSRLQSESTASSNGLNINLYPNPTENNFKVSFVLEKDSTIKIEMYDLNGNIIKNLLKEVTMQAGSYDLDFSIGDVSPGMYLIKVYNNSEVYNKKIIKL